jgi:hypothetical protein
MQIATDSSRSVDRLTALLRGRKLYHAAPLHYLPSIIAGGHLLAASAGQAQGISPRRSAFRRDRMLRVDKFVHLAFDVVTPLVRDKLQQGMPHCVLEFDAAEVLASNGRACALLPFNTKSWRSRASLQPVDAPEEMADILRKRDEFGRFASLELLVKSQLNLDALTAVVVFDPRDDMLVRSVASRFFPDILKSIRLVGCKGYEIVPVPETEAYFSECMDAGKVLAPPRIEFD